MNFPLLMIQRSPLFEGIETAHLQPMLTCLGASVRDFAKGAFVFLPGKPIDSVGLVLSGSAQVLQEDAEGNRNIIAEILPGESFAEAFACLSGVPLGIAVQAAQASAVLFMNVQRILTVCSSACSFHARLIRNLVTVLAKKDRQMNEKLTHLTQRTTRGKVLSYLHSESLRAGSREFDIPFDRQELADYLSVDRSALSVALCKLRDEKALAFQKNHFILSGKGK